MVRFQKTASAFNYVFEKELEAEETVILEIPKVSTNKRSINDIGWQTDGSIKMYGTISSEPDSDTALWQEINQSDEINKTVTALKVVNRAGACRVAVRVIFN